MGEKLYRIAYRFSNFGRNKNNESKQRKVAVEYVRLCGYKNGGDRQAQCQNGTVLSLDEIASQLGTSKRNLQRALSIERNLSEPMKQLLDDGVISKTVASDVIASLSDKEQEELISMLDITKPPQNSIPCCYNIWSLSEGTYLQTSSTLQLRIRQRSLIVVVFIGLFFLNLSIVELEI